MSKILWGNYRVAGMYYHNAEPKDRQRVSDFIKTGKHFNLQREPSNRYDSGAIRMSMDGILVGWVPKEYNRQLGIIMDNANVVVTAHIDPTELTKQLRDIRMDIYIQFIQPQLTTKKVASVEYYINDMITPIPLIL